MAQMPLDMKTLEGMKTHQKSSFVNVWEVLGLPTERHALEAFTLRQGVEICMVEASAIFRLRQVSEEKTSGNSIYLNIKIC